MEVSEFQTRVARWIEGHGGYFPPLANLARLTEETGELARAMETLFGSRVPKPGEDPGTPEEEIGDMLFVLAVIAGQTGVDLARAAEATLAKVELRDAGRYPAG